MKHVYRLSLSFAAVLLVIFLLLDFKGTLRHEYRHARQGHSPVPCKINSWNWRNNPRNGLGGWMGEIGHTHIGHGQY